MFLICVMRFPLPQLTMASILWLGVIIIGRYVWRGPPSGPGEDHGMFRLERQPLGAIHRGGLGGAMVKLCTGGNTREEERHAVVV